MVGWRGQEVGWSWLSHCKGDIWKKDLKDKGGKQREQLALKP